MNLIFDSHLDLAYNALSFNRDLTESLEQINQRERGMDDSRGRGGATVCFDEMRRGGVAVCLGVLLARTNRDKQVPLRIEIDSGTQEITCAIAQGQLAYYKTMEAGGHLHMIRSAGDLKAHWTAWQTPNHERLPIGLVLSMEGADGILGPQHVQAWWKQGLRVVSLVHYGHGVYATGTGACGGLTPKGVSLLREIRRAGMILDASHLCEQSFFEAMELFDGPVLASHNNCRGLVPGDRQFSDEQIRLLIGRGAVIGVAMDNWMLYPNYERGQTPRGLIHLEDVANHIDHICQLAGNRNHAGIGSDLDGAYGSEQCPEGLSSIADLQKLDAILSRRGYSGQDIAHIFGGNLMGLLQRALPV